MPKHTDPLPGGDVAGGPYARPAKDFPHDSPHVDGSKARYDINPGHFRGIRFTPLEKTPRSPKIYPDDD